MQSGDFPFLKTVAATVCNMILVGGNVQSETVACCSVAGGM